MNPNTKPATGCECNLHPGQLQVQIYKEVLLKEHSYFQSVPSTVCKSIVSVK